jgi:hypothetical protein
MGQPTYEHTLRLTVDPAVVATFDPVMAFAHARGRVNDPFDILRADARPAFSAIDVVVHLPGAESPSEHVTGLILDALGLPATPHGRAVPLLPAVPVSGRTYRGGRSFEPDATPEATAEDAEGYQDGGGSRRRRRRDRLGAGIHEGGRENTAPSAEPDDIYSYSGDAGTVYYSREPADTEGAATPAPAPGPDKRYLHGEYPEKVRPGSTFSLLVRIVTDPSGGAGLNEFAVPSLGADVLLILHAPGLEPLGEQRQTLHVPRWGNSEPVRFDLRGADPGARAISVTAWLGGSYLGELRAEVAVDPQGAEGPAREVASEVAAGPVPGAVSLVVRYVPQQNLYRFEFRDIDNPDEVTSQLAYEPGPGVERLVGELDQIAKDRSGYSEAETREYLVNAGIELWQTLIPQALRDQFWDRQGRIRQLTILADNDVVPWELLYPKDKGHDNGFLVEQFPVTRSVFGRPPSPRLNLRPARFVLPEPSPATASQEIQELSRVLDCGPDPETVVSAITPLQELLRTGDFGLLHFACHNTFDPAGGSAIKFGGARFTPTFLAAAGVDKTLARHETLVFVNACRSGGLAPSYNHLDGWAAKFLGAGAAAFIGSLWAVVDDTAREFAGEVYGHLLTGSTLGEAVTRARQAAASRPGDPTWLAYSVYGDPSATVA